MRNEIINEILLRTNHYQRSIMNKALLWPRRTGKETLHLARGEIGTAPSPRPAYLGAVLQPFVPLEHTMGLSTCASQSCWCIMCSMGDLGFPTVRSDWHLSSPESVSVRGMHFKGLVRPGIESQYLGPQIDAVVYDTVS